MYSKHTSPYSKEQLTLGAINRFVFEREREHSNGCSWIILGISQWRYKHTRIYISSRYCWNAQMFLVAVAYRMANRMILATNSKAHLCSIDKLQSKQQSLVGHNCIGAIKLKFKCMACVRVCAPICSYTSLLTRAHTHKESQFTYNVHVMCACLLGWFLFEILWYLVGCSVWADSSVFPITYVCACVCVLLRMNGHCALHTLQIYNSWLRNRQVTIN